MNSLNQKKTMLVRRAGVGKGVFTSLFILAAGLAYIENSKHNQVIVNEDPYNRTKKSFSDSIDKLSENRDARGAVDELQKAGQHVKQSAHLAKQAVGDSFEQTKKEGSQWVEQMKQDGREAVDQAKNKGDSIYRKAKEATEDNFDQLKRDGKNTFEQAKEATEDKFDQLKRDSKDTYEKTKRDIYDQVKKNTEKLRHDGANLKKNTQDAISQAVNDTKSAVALNESKFEHFREEHHLKEGNRTPEDVISHTSPTSVHETVKSTSWNHEKGVFDRASTAHGNPMVYEKHSANRTKPGWERRMEHYAENKVHDTSTLVGKDTEKVRSVWEDKAVRDVGKVPRQQEDPNSFWSYLFGKASQKVHNVENKLEHDWESHKQKWSHEKDDLSKKATNAMDDLSKKATDAKDDLVDKATSTKNEWYKKAEDVKDNVSDTIKNKTNDAKDSLYSKAESIKSEISNKAQDVKDSWSSKAQDVKDRAQDLERDIYNSAHDLHKEVSANTDKWRAKSTQKPKSWYEKNIDQVKSSFGSVKTAADKDLQWANDHHRDLTPAEVIVENANGKDM